MPCVDNAGGARPRRAVLVVVALTLAGACVGDAAMTTPEPGLEDSAAATTTAAVPTTLATITQAPTTRATVTTVATTSVASTTTTLSEPTPAELYAAHCAVCHGADMEGVVGPALGPGGHAHGHTDAELIAIITDGKNEMPAFGAKLTPDQIAELVGFIRTAGGE